MLDKICPVKSLATCRLKTSNAYLYSVARIVAYAVIQRRNNKFFLCWALLVDTPD